MRAELCPISHRPPLAFPAPTELQVPMHNLLLVEVTQAADQAPQVLAHFWLRHVYHAPSTCAKDCR